MINYESFKELGLSDRTIEALDQKGFIEPSEIQQLCIPLLLQENTEVIGQAQTGSGKTAAFALPIIETLDGGKREPEALVLCPTRELAVQVSEEIKSLKGTKGIEVTAIYGGASIEPQLRKLRYGVDVVVGTPGRVMDHIRRGTLKLDNLKFTVLDEADEMLDMGFVDDIEEILALCPEEKRMLMFSATMPKEILRIAENFMHDYQLVRTQLRDTSCKNTKQYYYEVREADKLELLTRLIDREVEFYGVVFCRTKISCEEIAGKLISRGYDAGALHGDLSQREREVMLRKMKEKRLNILVATDVAARGLDIQDLTHVVNYNIPEDPEVYIHRVGRTGRAGKEGTAITFITGREVRKFSYIRKASSSEIEKMEIPTADEIIAAKRKKIYADLRERIGGEPQEEYMKLAFDLLEGNPEPLKAFAALLESMYKSALDKKQYKAIKDPSARKKEERKRGSEMESFREGRSFRNERGDRNDWHDDRDDELARLFIARGRNDGLTKRGLANILIDQCGCRDEELMNIEVMEEFSFVNTPNRIAKKILDYFQVPKGKGKPIVTRAHEDKKPSSGKKCSRKGHLDNNQTKSKRRKGWQEDYQPYGRDTRDDEDGFYRMPAKSGKKDRKKKRK